LGGRRNRGREVRRRAKKQEISSGEQASEIKNQGRITGVYTHRGTCAPVDLLVSEAEPPCCVVQLLHAHVQAGYGGAARSRVPSERSHERSLPSLSPTAGEELRRTELAKKREGESWAGGELAKKREGESWAGGQRKKEGKGAAMESEAEAEKASRNPSVWEQCGAMGGEI